MSDRSRRIAGVVLLVVGVAVLGYVAIEVLLVLRGDLEAGPVRLATLALNAATAVALLFLGQLIVRAKPPKG